MKTIHKYEIDPLEGYQIISTFEDAEVLTVGRKGSSTKIFVWMAVDTKRPVEKIAFEIYGTGQEIPDDKAKRKYVGTFQFMLDGGLLVAHTFQIMK